MEDVKIEIIDPKVELLAADTPYEVAELCARVCYKSEERITKDSWKEFLMRLARNGHTAMLEHATLYLTFSYDEEQQDEVIQEIVSSPYSSSLFEDCTEGNGRWYVTTNLRVLYNIMSAHYFPPDSDTAFMHALSFAESHRPLDITKCTRRLTLKFTCDRGVSHELVRHRVFSFAQESTRYCRYDKRGFLFVKPAWYDKRLGQFENLSLEHTLFLASCQQAAETYNTLLSLGQSAQEARAVLPNALKTEVCMTGTLPHWLNFFKLRCDEHAHPDMQVVANMAKEIVEEACGLQTTKKRKKK